MVRSLLKTSGVLRVLSDKPVNLAVSWSNRKRISVDILGMIGDQMVVVEYDGSYYHGPDGAREKDAAKTLALLDAGYLVIRLRENNLEILEIKHPRLLQVSFPYTQAESVAEEQLSPVLDWVQGFIQEIAA